ncbi:toll-Interleukin receptor [Alteromonas gracilis]|uniref:toll-Interleukin receptor n=1 Tax=Alteromonas gracilis TaxID=1479524 RepID=UPI0037357303
MNIFLSWSGERSKAIAELMDEWLQCVIQAVDPWMSSKDIDRGSLWFSEINGQLQNTTIGIICLTQENKNKPWILFEAGALAKGLSTNRVCTFLIDLEPSDVGTPLSQFNHTIPLQDSMWELVRTLNNSLKEKSLKEKTLEQVFQTYWPQFDQSFKAILIETPATEVIEKRSEDDILAEILATTRSMDKRVRSLESERRAPRLLSGRGFDTTERIQFKTDNGSIKSVYIRGLKDRINSYMDADISFDAVVEILSKEHNIPASEMSKKVRSLIDL